MEIVRRRKVIICKPGANHATEGKTALPAAVSMAEKDGWSARTTGQATVSALLRLPAQAEPGQVAQLDGPGDGVGGDKVQVVEMCDQIIMIDDRYMAHPVDGGFGRGKEDQEAGPTEEGGGEGEEQANCEFFHHLPLFAADSGRVHAFRASCTSWAAAFWLWR